MQMITNFRQFFDSNSTTIRNEIIQTQRETIRNHLRFTFEQFKRAKMKFFENKSYFRNKKEFKFFDDDSSFDLELTINFIDKNIRFVIIFSFLVSSIFDKNAINRRNNTFESSTLSRIKSFEHRRIVSNLKSFKKFRSHFQQ